jgi:hypothetical protein
MVDEDRISDAIANNTWMIATHIRELGVPPAREQQIARNVSIAVRIALAALDAQADENCS